MKAVIAFNQMNDVLFMHCDEAFRDHVNKQAVTMGILAESQVHDPMDPNVVVQMFSPLVMSQSFMTSHMQNPYHTITCEDGKLFVFEQLNDQIHLAINGDGTEQEDFLHRKLLVLQKLLAFLYGPVCEELRPAKAADRDHRWRFLANLLDTWCELYGEEQSFLIEAVERLHVNQELNYKCIELLEGALSTMKTNGERGIVHALLLVNAKLLSLYSTRHASELLAVDILLMILLAKAAFPSHQRLEDLFSQSYSSPGTDGPGLRHDDTYESACEENDDSEEVEYFSTPSTPRESPGLKEEFKTPQAAREGAYGGILETDAAESPEDVRPFRGWSNVSSLLSSEEVEPYQRYTVFLGTQTSRYTPHTLHCLNVVPGVALILVTETARGKQASPICQVLMGIQAILQQQEPLNRTVIDAVDSNLRKILEFIKKIKGPRKLVDVTGELMQKWDTAKSNGLLQYLEGSRKDHMAPNLESPLESMVVSLKELFKRLYITPGRYLSNVPANVGIGLEQVLQNMKQGLWDYKDLLAVKAQRNITITSYMDEFPGLVHFIYVNRTSHQMMAPSVNVSSEIKDENMSLLIKIKRKIWQQIPEIQNRLCEGFFQQSFHESDLLFTYQLWFEDMQGNPLSLQQPYRGCPENIMPGILAGNFYRHLMQQCLPAHTARGVQCFELLMVHVGLITSPHMVTSNPFVQRHFRRLAMKLWEAAGEANSPISLI